jgi:STE24 endopeptidase
MLKLPCEIIRIFRLENRFGNNKRLKYYLLELFLKGIITLFAGSAAYGLLLVSYAWLNESFWYMSWILFALFFLIYTMINQRITYFFSSKRHASVSDSLRKQLRDLLKDFRLSVKDVLIRKHQPGKQKNPASLTLWGRKGKIMLSEYVLSLLKDDEIKAVIVHEAAHYKRYHILNLLLTTLLQIGLLLFLLGVSLSTPYFQQALGASYQTVYMGLLVFVLLFSPASLIINYFINRLNRHFEYQADEEVKKAGLGLSLANALQKLAAEEHVNLSPHPLYVQFYYQHPDLKNRLSKLTES